jgi:hypothetical protein
MGVWTNAFDNNDPWSGNGIPPTLKDLLFEALRVDFEPMNVTGTETVEDAVQRRDFSRRHRVSKTLGCVKIG